jgi:indole-3-glycerol phosphate synthase/phosphoribosylanthranilate isomerase
MSRIRELLERKRADVDRRKIDAPLSADQIPQDDRRIALDPRTFHLFAEIKRASLSAGSIRPNIELTLLARSYQEAGASVISILTEQHFFGGSLEDLRAVRNSVTIPILQKDFIIDEYQVLEAKAAGADFVLLIVRFLQPDLLARLIALCDEIKMNALVEINDQQDALICNQMELYPAYIGVNSRDLESLVVDPGRFAALRSSVRGGFLIAESGIADLAALDRVLELGYNGALVGEHFLRAGDPASVAASFVRHARRGTMAAPQIKICGITSEADALMAVREGADALGFIFAESPRRIDPKILSGFRSRIPQHVMTVGVFRGNSKREIEATMRDFRLDVAQLYDPIEISGKTWRAKTISGIAALDSESNQDSVLWDLKLEGKKLEDGWQALGRTKIFALAGGLQPDNVERAISFCHPCWVDVARGVEKSPGIKDRALLQAFFRAVRRTGQAQALTGGAR